MGGQVTDSNLQTTEEELIQHVNTLKRQRRALLRHRRRTGEELTHQITLNNGVTIHGSAIDLINHMKAEKKKLVAEKKKLMAEKKKLVAELEGHRLHSERSRL